MRPSRLAKRRIVLASGALAWLAASPAEAAPAATSRATDAETPPHAKPPPPAGASEYVSPGGDWKFALHGIVGASAYVQDTAGFVFNGQGPLLPLNKPSDGFTTGGDVRQTRLNFSVSGPRVLGAAPKALVEIDFFGLNGTGGYGEVSVLPRLRLAYSELNWGDDIIRIGQDYELIMGLIPEGMGHMAYPVTYFNGLIGWREPSITYFHSIPIDTSSKLELAASLLKSDWQNPADFGLSNLNDLNVDLGQLSGLPGVEARVKYQMPGIMAFVAGHYNKVMGTHANSLVFGPNNPVTGTILDNPHTPTRNWDVVAATAGVKASYFGFTLGVNVYTGKNLGPFLGEQLQFIVENDVNEFGGWGELGYDITKQLNAYIIGGTSQLNQSDLQHTNGGGRLSSTVLGGMIRYQEKGFALGPEFYHVMSKVINADGSPTNVSPGATKGEIDVNQFMLSGMYFF
jgi:hypothetical protein